MISTIEVLTHNENEKVSFGYSLSVFLLLQFFMQTSYVFIIEIIMNVQEFFAYVLYLPYYLLLLYLFVFLMEPIIEQIE